MTKERKDELLDLVLQYNNRLRADTKDMTNEERVYFLEAHLTAVGGATDIFRKAVAAGHGDAK